MDIRGPVQEINSGTEVVVVIKDGYAKLENTDCRNNYYCSLNYISCLIYIKLYYHDDSITGKRPTGHIKALSSSVY